MDRKKCKNFQNFVDFTWWSNGCLCPFVVFAQASCQKSVIHSKLKPSSGDGFVFRAGGAKCSVHDPRMTPNRVNRTHWPTKENKQNFCIFSIFPAHAKNCLGWPQMGPGGFFFRLIQTLPTFWATRIFILIIFIFLICWAPSLDPAWAQLGPVGPPAWARLGPGLGQLGPGLGPA